MPSGDRRRGPAAERMNAVGPATIEGCPLTPEAAPFLFWSNAWRRRLPAMQLAN